MSAAEVARYLKDQNLQLSGEFAAAYGLKAYIDKDPGGWPVSLLGASDVQGALGYHDYSGTPFAKVFVDTSKQVGVAWQTTASHEVLEMVADPGPVFASVKDAAGNFWDYEACDAVEDIAYEEHNSGATIADLSDFVTPAWYKSGSSGPWDYSKVLTHDHGITSGGYAVENGSQITGPAVTATNRMREWTGKVSIDRVYKKQPKWSA